MNQLNWKQWKRGLLVAFIAGVATGLVGLAAGVTLKDAGILFGVSIGKDILLYISKHPADQIQDTTFIANPNLNQKDNTK